MPVIPRKRSGEILAMLLRILSGAPEGMRASAALKALAESMDLTEHERGVYPSTGKRRFEKIARFSTIGAVKAGWLIKNDGIWTVTDEGKSALTQFADPEAFYRECARLFAKWKELQSGAEVPVPTVENDATSDEEPYVSASVTFEEASEQAQTEIEQYISVMPPFEFQKLVAGLLQAMDYHVSWVAPPGKDGGVDIIAHRDPLGAQPPRIKVQVKRMQQKVDQDTVKSFAAIVGNDDVGLFVATGGFTRDAEEYARKQESRRMTLISLEKLLELWIRHYPRLDEADRQRLPLTPIYFLTPST